MPIFRKFNLLALVCASVFFFPAFTDGADRYDVPIDTCPSLGPENAPLTIIEFIDYQ